MSTGVNTRPVLATWVLISVYEGEPLNPFVGVYLTAYTFIATSLLSYRLLFPNFMLTLAPPIVA